MARKGQLHSTLTYVIWLYIHILWTSGFVRGVKHYSDVIMTTMASQITSLTIVYSIVYPDGDQRKHHKSNQSDKSTETYIYRLFINIYIYIGASYHERFYHTSHIKHKLVMRILSSHTYWILCIVEFMFNHDAYFYLNILLPGGYSIIVNHWRIKFNILITGRNGPNLRSIFLDTF